MARAIGAVGLRLRGLVVRLGVGLVLLAGTGLVVLGLTTVQSLYRGEWNTHPGTRVSGVAAVGECERTGPVSRYGFGYWWSCRARISLADGRSVDATLAPSIVTPGDRGRAVRLVEDCASRERQECSYTRPGSYLLGLGVRAMQYPIWILAGLGVILAGVFFVQGVLGPALTLRLLAARGRDWHHQDGDVRISLLRMLLAVVVLYALLYAVIRLTAGAVP